MGRHGLSEGATRPRGASAAAKTSMTEGGGKRPLWAPARSHGFQPVVRRPDFIISFSSPFRGDGAGGGARAITPPNGHEPNAHREERGALRGPEALVEVNLRNVLSHQRANRDMQDRLLRRG